MTDVVLLTIAGAGEDALKSAAAGLLNEVGASSGSVHVRAGTGDLPPLQALDTERDIDGMITVRGAGTDVVSHLALPPGARLVGAYAAEEVVRRDYERTWSAGAPSPGISLLCFVRRRPDLSWQAYSDHWRNRHGPLALRRQPGFWRYVQNHLVGGIIGDAPYLDGIGELHFRTAADVADKMFDSPEGQEEIMEDTYRFMSHEGSTTLPSTEWLL